MKLLHIDSSVLGESSASRQISAAIVTALSDTTPGLEVVRRDLEAAPLPHLSAKLLPTIRPDAGGQSSAAETDEAAAVLQEFLDADIVVIGAPMYNFTVSTQLKAWIDRILIAGKTFAYSEAGPTGLAGGKRVIVASSRGGLYAPGMPSEANDFHETYLGAVFRFIGVETIEIVRAEGLAYGPDQREAALSAALASIPSLAASFAPALAA
ncbi:MAG: FMN-dependent NADH-azoreductase [Caulobacteraceae bacterium]|jgi:FMN-dependent NADH-azoreductase|nr:FMN-dependent NADH-azoreductase [Caulobacteraceae bacterium]